MTVVIESSDHEYVATVTGERHECQARFVTLTAALEWLTELESWVTGSGW